jgi:ariadne-1
MFQSIYTACIRYETGRKEGKYNEEEAKRERAKQSLERYMHYYQRFAENDKARKQVQQMRPVHTCFPTV